MGDLYKFDSQITTGRHFDQKFNQDEVKNEPMLFSCDRNYALDHGGPITRAFIRAFEKDRPYETNFIIDSRVHMLMPGWYPAIPGYHHDDVPRGADGQPNYKEPAYHAQHCMGLVNGDICPTEFATGEGVFVTPDEGPIYKQWHLDVVSKIDCNKMRKVVAPSGKLVFFDAHAFHQGTAAVAGGWRWFGRISWSTDRKVFNEIRRQVQVYLENPMEGW